MIVRTPMGPAAPGSRLERRGEAERIINHLIQAGWRLPFLAEELGVGVHKLYQWRAGKGPPPSPDQIKALRFYIPRLNARLTGAAAGGAFDGRCPRRPISQDEQAQAELELRRAERREFFKWVSLAIAGIAAIAAVALAINAWLRIK